jgi:hypothetical protein
LKDQGLPVYANVIDDLVDDGEGGMVKKAVSVGIWALRDRKEKGLGEDAADDQVLSYLRPLHGLLKNGVRANGGDMGGGSKLNCSARLDMNMTHAIHYDHQFSMYQRKYLDKVYGKQLYLNTLATHPDFDGRGYAAAQLAWGKSLNSSEGGANNITLISSPAGYELYKTSGFESLRNLTMTKVGGGYLEWFEAMRWDPRWQK